MFKFPQFVLLVVILTSFMAQGCSNKNKAAGISTEKPVAQAPVTPPPTPSKLTPEERKKRRQFNPRALVREFAAPYPYKNLTSGKEDSTFMRAVAAYSNENWTEAFDIFFKMNPKTDQTLMYEASCKMQVGFYGHSKQILTTLLSVARGQTLEHAQWFMALSELGLSKKPQAKEQFKKIISNPNHPFATQAAEILARIPN